LERKKEKRKEKNDREKNARFAGGKNTREHIQEKGIPE